MERQEKKGLSRREFMKAAGVTAAGVMAGSLVSEKLFAAAPAAGKVIGANDRINIGFIGVGGMGGGHVNTVKGLMAEQNLAVLGGCDVWKKRRDWVKEQCSLADNQVFGDYRKLLENKDIDAVIIATPDHWHAQIAMDAMEAGKHVYVEKPMTHTLDEAFKMQAVAKKTGKLVQVGSQGCTDTKWHVAGKAVKDGKVGQVLWAQGSYCRNNSDGEWNYGIDSDMTPDTCDWKTWLGVAPKREFSPERFFRWRKYWDYGSGIIGDLWPHRLHPLMIAMALEDFPHRVACLGANVCNTDEGHGELRDVADNTMMVAEFPNGAMIHLGGSTVNELGLEDLIRGHKANIYFGGGKVQIKPERAFVDEIDEEELPVVGPGESHPDHHKNWYSSIRTNTQPNCPIDLGVRVQTIVSMAIESYRKSKMAIFDPDKKRII